ncbi:MAG: hypothetical protein methR_P1301 [Methyloprofundus sp.]|nr:MAG: hypothetical protein methR_P1301 [Methyloprofundus sp.]
MKNIFKATAVAILCANTINAQAIPVQWTSGAGANNHWYDFIGGSNTWTSAQTSALGSTFNGMTGYLATITSAEENNFLVALSSIDGWIGATDEANEGEWLWANGPEAGTQFWQGTSTGAAVGGNFSSWNTGEPNNVGAVGEDYAHLQGGRWNDLPNGSNRGYFVEFSGVTSSVPEPMTLWLLASGLIGFGAMRKKYQ